MGPSDFKQNGEFVARMEQVLDVYKRPYDPRHSVVCMEESPRQLILGNAAAAWL